jgi:RND family efflux transporter MFP subunit
MITTLLFSACHNDTQDTQVGHAAAHVAVTVRTVTIAPQPFTEVLDVIGTVVPRAGHVASLGAPVSARIAQVFVNGGQRVVAGQPLVQLDQTAVQASAQSAGAALAAAQAAFERAQRLANQGIVPRKDVEQASADLAKARAEAVTTQRAATLSTIRSPIAGVVMRMNALLGATADPNTPLVEIADPSALDIVLNLTATDAARIHTGAHVVLSAGSRTSGESLGVGTVADIGAMVDSAMRTVAVRVRATSVRRSLRVGETVVGEIAVATIPNALVVPLDAVVPDGDAFKVFVVDAAGIAHAHTVTVVSRTDAVARIGSGIVSGDRVVTYGAYGIDDSTKVQIATDPRPSATVHP